MKEKFGKRSLSIASLKNFIYPLFCLVIALVFLFLIRSFGEDTLARQQQSLETALQRDIAQCYAVEGIYPPSLSYLEEHYGLTYDHDTFFVDYQSIGSNLYPDVTVINRKEGNNK